MTNPTFENTYQATSTLTKTSSHTEVQEVLALVAKYGPEPFEQDKLLRSIARQVGVGLKVIKQEYMLVLKKLNLEPNDIGFVIAQRTIEKFYATSGLRYHPDGNFYVYAATHWRMTTKAQVRANIQEMAVDYLPYADGKSLKALVSEALGCLQDFLGTDDDILNCHSAPQPVLNFENGELWINKNGSVELLPHKPESRLFYCLPYKYDPEAKAPKYEQALLEIFSESEKPEELVRHWHEFVGYTIQPMRFIACFFMMIGHGRNGKTMLLKTVQNLLGPGTVLNDSLCTFQKDQFNAAALHGKLLFVDDDMNSKVTLADGLLKKISEAKEMSARHPYGKTKFHFKCLALPVMAGNHYPACADLSEGMLRRINIFPFNRQFSGEEADAKLFDYIWTHEMPGVLNLALDGLQRVLKRSKFDPPADCDNALNEFLMHSNPMWCFIEENLEPNVKGRIKLPEFRAFFELWAKNQGFSKEPVLDKTLKRRLEGLGFEIVKNQGTFTIKGFSFKKQEQAA